MLSVTPLDRGYIVPGGEKLWLGLPGYQLVDSIGVEDAKECVSYPVEVIPARTREGHIIDGGNYIARLDQFPPAVLAANIGSRYELIPRTSLMNLFDRHLLSEYPMHIVGTGTLSGGTTWWLQMALATYSVAGDSSEHQLRWTYTESYGATGHQIFLTHIRVVCENTLHFAREDAIAAGLFANCRHTASAVAKIEAKAEHFAELQVQLARDKALLDYLAKRQADSKMLEAFIAKVLPEPTAKPGKEEISVRERNRWKEAVATVRRNYEEGVETMDESTAFSHFGLIQAYSDFLDHSSYSRSKFDRWIDSLNGDRAKSKADAMQWLLQSA